MTKYAWDIIAHHKQLAEIEHDLLHHELGHAYLLSGTGHIGKFTIASKMAAILQCPNGFCQTCPTCIQVKKGSHLDTIQISDVGESIKIEQVRDILMRLNMTGQGNYKILLIKNIERLTNEAANCILKTLEEPPQNTIFIFTTESLSEILPTIRSRVRTIKFTPVPEKMLQEALLKRFPDTESSLLEKIIPLSLGKPGRAIALIEDTAQYDFFRELYKTVERMCQEESIAERFISGVELCKDPLVFREFLDMLTYHLRGKLITDPVRQRHIAGLLEAIQELKTLMKRNVNAKLLMENLILKLHPLHTA